MFIGLRSDAAIGPAALHPRLLAMAPAPLVFSGSHADTQLHPTLARWALVQRWLSSSSVGCWLTTGTGGWASLQGWSVVALNPVNSMIIQTDGALQHTDQAASVYPSVSQWLAHLEATVFAEPSTFFATPSFNEMPISTASWLGWFSYEAYQLFEPALAGLHPVKSSSWPLAALWQFEDWLWISPDGQTLEVVSPCVQRRRRYLQEWKQWEASAPNVVDIPLQNKDVAGFENASFATPEEFAYTVDQVLAAIHRGELYQANLSQQWRKPVEACPVKLFVRLGYHNPSPFAALLKTPWGWLVSNSPERLLHHTAQGELTTRPIAGTRGRGITPSDDTMLGEQLRANPKERAEHAMLVDLMRNDLGRVCEPGSVVVDDWLALERYSHVTHLVSNVTGQRKSGVSLAEAFGAVFPGGTITGCPKIRCIQTLHSLEPVARGPYTGSLGYVCPATQTMDWNILIRTLMLTPAGDDRWLATVQAGAGIVADSVAAHEDRECARKATALMSVV